MWLKGGLLGTAFALVSLALMYAFFYIHSVTDVSFFAAIGYGIFLLIITGPASWITFLFSLLTKSSLAPNCNLESCVPESLYTLYLVAIINLFIFGAIIGWIISRRRKK